MDTGGNRAAHTEIQAIQGGHSAHGGADPRPGNAGAGAGGLSQDLPLAAAFAHNRTVCFADGPDEVNAESLARRELSRLCRQES